MSNKSLIYGINPIYEILKLNKNKFTNIFLVDSKDNSQTVNSILDIAKHRKIEVHYLSKKDFENKFPNVQTGGIAAYFEPKRILDEHDLKSNINAKIEQKPDHKWLFLILDNLQDPNNLGACLRTAEACNVDGVIITKNSSAPITEAVRKVAAGATEALDIYSVTNLARILEFLQSSNIWLVGTSLKSNMSIYDVDFKSSIGIIMGNEGAGIRELTAKNCDFLVKLPMSGNVQSLNVSVATGITLFEVIRQRYYAK